MTDYYSTARECSFHPGGWKLTNYAVQKSNLPENAAICDIGGGKGESAEKLHQLGYRVTVVEPSEGMNSREDTIRATAENTTLPTGLFDAVLLECVLSLCEDPEKAMREAARILKKGGRLILSDLYSAQGGRLQEGPVKNVFAESTILPLVKNAGFRMHAWEDRTHDMTTMALQLIMDGKAEEVCETFSFLKENNAGYFLLLAEKE